MPRQKEREACRYNATIVVELGGTQRQGGSTTVTGTVTSDAGDFDVDFDI